MTPQELLVWRHRRWLSQERLASLLGVTTMTIYRWESGKGGYPPYLELALAHLDDTEEWSPNADGHALSITALDRPA